MATRLGLEAGVVRLVAYDPAWPELFAAEARRITASVRERGAPPLRLEHVGSTAVPGLSAKPVLDLLAGHRADVPAATYVDALTEVGYVYRGDRGLPGREFFRRGQPRSHHVHLTAIGGPHWHDYLDFRDALRTDAGLAAAYGELKAALAARHPRDREAYIAGKTAFVRGVLAMGAARPARPR